jgi:adenosylcobyric acid synthase
MSNNSFVTTEGLEMGRAQVIQAYAAGVEPDVRMNPVLLKPSSNTGSQVVLAGKPAFYLDAKNWHASRSQLRTVIQKNYEHLNQEYDLIVLEGAGSPAEINLKQNDVVNMGMAKMADANVLLVGDIDKGGVFASLLGTIQLLDDVERKRVKGFLINKFRGNLDLLKPGLVELERLTGIPVLGVIPWVHHSIDDEDGASSNVFITSTNPELDICVLHLPHVSNSSDFTVLGTIESVALRWCKNVSQMGNPDLLIIPGTKATVSDLALLKKLGWDTAIKSYASKGGRILGICGGLQMLGHKIIDSEGVESDQPETIGLGLLDLVTTFYGTKTTMQLECKIHADQIPWFNHAHGVLAKGYEIHMGQSEFGNDARVFTSHNKTNGVSNLVGNICGTYLHGFFDQTAVAYGMVNSLRVLKGLQPIAIHLKSRHCQLIEDIDAWAHTVRYAIDMQAIYEQITPQ